MALLSIRLLGAFVVERNEQPITTFRSLKNQALLAYLAVEATRPHTRPALAGLLWPEQPETEGYLNLRQALFRLRKVLANDEATPPFLQITQNTVQFEPHSDHWLDAAAFSHLLEACDKHARVTDKVDVQPGHEPTPHRSHCLSCMERLTQAMDLYQGEFMHGIYIDDSPALEEWLLLRREWFHHQALAALYDLATGYEAQGAYSRAYTYARRQLDLDPLREEAHRQLLRALALDGKRSEALAHYEACCDLLYQELGVSPAPETERLVTQIERGELNPQRATRNDSLAQSITVQTTAAQPTLQHNLPALGTTFLGREPEVARLCELLLGPTQRLVTVVGPGGVGKTRLVLAAANNLVGAFTDGVWFVALVGVEKSSDVVTALARALGFTFQGQGEPQQQLFDYLRSRETLLILDNFEQVMPAADLVQALLERAPRLKLLVTSRERLNFQSEMTLALAGLPFPPPIPLATDDYAPTTRTFSSVQLFVDRAQGSPVGFTLDDENLPAVVEICRLVEGAPFAIELAASWAEHYTCAEIAQAIRENLDFLSSSRRDLPPRHRSLRAAFDYSWRLLTVAEQDALAQMTVFRGTFSRAAAQAVTVVALPQLTALVNKSLVRSIGPGRYTLHEVVRQFAAEALADPQNAVTYTGLQERYVIHYLRFVGNQAGLFGQTPQKAVAEIMQEVDNVRQAWRWAVTQWHTDALAIAVTNLARFYDLVGLYREAVTAWELALAQWQATSGRDLSGLPCKGFQKLTALPVANPGHALLAIQLYLEQARSYFILGQYTEAMKSAQSALGQALVCGEQSAAPPLQAAALQQVGLAYYRQGDYAAALPSLEEAVALAQTAQNSRLLADCLLSLGEVQMYQGDAAGRASFDQALTLYRVVGDRRGEGAALHNLGLFAHMQSDFGKGKEFFEQALRIHRALGDRHNEAVTLNSLSSFYSKQGNFSASDHALRQSLHLARLLGYRTGEVQALTGLGVNQMTQRQANAARVYFEEALPIARQCGYLRGEGALLNNLGNLASDEAAYAQAESFYREALAVAQKSGDRYYVCGRLHNLGNMRRFQGDYVGAHEYYAESATIATAIGDRWIEGSARSDLALASIFLCDEAQAIRHCNQALFLARAIGDRWCECKVLAILGWLAVIQHHDLAGLALIEEAIDLAQAAQEMGVEGAAHARYGFALLTLGQLAAAVPAFQRSIALRHQTGDQVQIVTPLSGLAAAYLALGELGNAQTQIEAVLRQVGDRPIGVADDPLRVYAACFHVLRAAGDGRAATILQHAYSHLAEQASRLTDTLQRKRFTQRYETALFSTVLQTP